jgi:phosphoglucosamine mutase
MTPEVAVRSGRALVAALENESGAPRVLVGKDTRISGDMLEHAIASGICSAGGNALLCGIIPTPAIAYLTAAREMDAGVVISASHNPYEDNGIKFFNSRGFKLSRSAEAAMEQMIQGTEPEKTAASGGIGAVIPVPELESAYVAFLFRTAGPPALLKGMKVVLDCSNGATYRTAPQVFQDLGAAVHTLGAEPDGKNINQGCGSQDTGALRQQVLESASDIGLAFDGDGDRLIAVDANGRTVTGDQILAICAKHLKEGGNLPNNRVVSTVMSNVGFHRAMAELGIELIITDVGDRNVLEQMQEKGAIIGGEDSGHMIFLDSHTSGDGILTGLRLLRVMRETGEPLSRLASIMDVYPQVLMNVSVEETVDIRDIPEIQSVIHRIENELGDRGRVLVRYSGTQPLCRVMVEGPDPEQTRRYCAEIAESIRERIGAAQ